MKSAFRAPLATILSLLFVSTLFADDVYQWSVPVYGGADRRAYLWVPPECHRVRALVVGLNNMQEEHLFQYDDFRKNLADLNMGIVWIYPGFAITTILAWTTGDDHHRSADRPIHPFLSNNLKDGTAQTIDFPQIANQPLDTKSIPLQATASSGLPVQFFVVSGPATIDEANKNLIFAPVPPNAKEPVRIRVGAYQWGSPNAPRFQTAPEAIQEFFVGGDPTPVQLTPPSAAPPPDATKSDVPPVSS